MNKNSILSCVLAVVSLLLNHSSKAQNLLVNPGAEDGPPGTTGWTVIKGGSACSGGSGWRMPGPQSGYPTPHSGAYFFMPGCGGVSGTQYEVRQDVNVTSNAAAIDAGKYTVSFSGYMQSFAQSPADQTQIIVEYRDAANTTVLSTYNTGVVANQSVWTQYADTRVAPAGTRFIRVRLIAIHHSGDAIDSYFDDISLTGVSTLPLKFLSFSAAQSNDNVMLHWKTADEINCKEFVVEKSSDNIHFIPVTTIAAKGGSVNEYSYEDRPSNMVSGKISYRLKQIDNDGSFAYSTIVLISLANKDGVQIVIPNPVKGSVSLSIKTGKRGTGNIGLIDYSGRTVLTKDISVNAGTNTVLLENTSNLRDGIYVLKLNLNGQVLSHKFVIQH